MSKCGWEDFDCVDVKTSERDRREKFSDDKSESFADVSGHELSQDAEDSGAHQAKEKSFSSSKTFHKEVHAEVGWNLDGTDELEILNKFKEKLWEMQGLDTSNFHY